MNAMQPGKGSRCKARGLAVAMPAAFALAALIGGCGTSIQTPLPEVKPVSSTELSQEDRKKAVDELNRKRATHEQDAEQQIEQSR